MKIIQLAVALNNEGEESLYALCDDGTVMQRRWASNPRETVYRDRPSTFLDGWTEGWIPIEGGWSMPIKHPNEKRDAA
jgi:hypothetical protein